MPKRKTGIATLEVSDEPVPADKTKHTKKAAKKATRNSFSPEDKSSALKMLAEGSTLKQTAEHFGCSVAALQQWKAKFKPSKAGKKAAKKTTRKPRLMPNAIHQEGWKRFIREYFEHDNKVAEILASPPVEGFDLLSKVNDALSFAYDYFKK